MNKFNISRVLILVLSLVLMISMAVAVSVSAEGETAPKLEIISQNLSYEGQTHIFYAVSYEGIENPEAISLEVSWTEEDGTTKTVTVTESEEQTIEDTLCRTFKTPGVDAKNYTKVFTAVAKTDTIESAAKTFSVAEYCNLWLTYISTLETPTEDDLKVKAACEATLQYGTTVQALLNYYPAANTADYPSNYSYVKAIDGTVNGGNSAHVIGGTSVTLTYTGTTPEGQRIGGWKVYYTDGRVVSVGRNGVFAPEGNCYATVEFKEEFVAGSGYYINNLRTPGSLTVDYSYEKYLNTFEHSTKPGFTSEDQTTGSASVAIVDEKLEFAKKEAGYEEYIFWNAIGYPTGATKLVFELDVCFNDISTKSGEFSKITIRNMSGYWLSVPISIDESTGQILVGNKGYLSVDEWYNLALVCEFNLETGEITVGLYVDNEYEGNVGFTVKEDSAQTGRAHLYLAANEAGSITLDNVFFSYDDGNLGGGAYYKDSESYPSLRRYNYNDGTAQPVYENNGVAATVAQFSATKFYNCDLAGESNNPEYLSFPGHTAVADATSYVFEFDFMVNKAIYKITPQVRLRIFGYDIIVKTDCWDHNGLYMYRDSSVGSKGYAKCDTWNNVRYVFTKTETDGTFNIAFYLNNSLVCESTISGTATSSTTNLILMPSNTNLPTNLYVDNVAYGYITAQ